MSCAHNTYDIGDTVKLTVLFEAAGVDTDPPTVTCSVRSPLGTVTTYIYNTHANLTRSAAGAYACFVAPDRHGIWEYRWAGVDASAVQVAVRGAEVGRFEMRRSAFV